MVEPQAEAQAPQMAQIPQIFIAPSNFPPPKSLIFDDNLATTWESWKKAWTRYEIAIGVQKQEGIRDDRVRERLLRLNDLMLQKAVDTIKAAEQTQQQVKLMSTGEDFVNTLKENTTRRRRCRKLKKNYYSDCLGNKQIRSVYPRECCWPSKITISTCNRLNQFKRETPSDKTMQSIIVAAYQPVQCREELKPYPLPFRPWET
ncbi:Hypothetical predicted protein, partial [Paramuricea clavata]